MNTFFNLFETREAGKSASTAEKDSQKPGAPNHKEDASQGGEFLDDVIWETDPAPDTGSPQDFLSN